MNGWIIFGIIVHVSFVIHCLMSISDLEGDRNRQQKKINKMEDTFDKIEVDYLKKTYPTKEDMLKDYQYKTYEKLSRNERTFINTFYPINNFYLEYEKGVKDENICWRHIGEIEDKYNNYILSKDVPYV